MARGGLSELEAVALLRAVYTAGSEAEAARGAHAGAGRRGSIERGIGDDAAVLRVAGAHLVWSVDASVQGVHFDRRWLDLGQIAERAFHAAASDLAAMGARPLGALSALVLPAGLRRRELERLAAGTRRASDALGCPVVGGNIARGGELSLTTGVLGTVSRPLCRDGARPGDEVWLVGELGLAAAGLRLLQRGVRLSALSPRLRPSVRRCVEAWRAPRARLVEGQRLVGRASALIDVSDGLAADAAQLARASGVALIVEASRLERSLDAGLVEVARLLGQEPTALAAEGGEDYALLATGPARRCPRGALRLGRIEAGEGAWLETSGDRRERLTGGYDHLAARRSPRRKQ